MTVNESKNFLRHCLKSIAPLQDIDTLFCCKYANRKRAEEYQKDEIVSKLTAENRKSVNAGVPYVVTCFIHLEIYVAWHQSVGKGNGKYTVYKRDLVAFENTLANDYMECVVGDAEDSIAYIFRNESGFTKFYNKITPSETDVV